MKKTTILALLLLLCVPAFAQPFMLLFESPQDFGLGFKNSDGILHNIRTPLDVNRDGTPDLFVMEEDDQGNPQALVAYDVATGTQVINFPYEVFVQTLNGQDPTHFIGIVEFQDGDDLFLIFRSKNRLAALPLSSDGSGKHTDEPFTLPAKQALVLDLTNDGLPELIIRNPETRTVQVYSRSATSTATEDDIARALHRLFQNYPNPFREATTIGYEVEQAGPVTITVYDILGRAIRTLVDQDQAIGTYHIAWDGRDAAGRVVASGTYFYRLRVGEAVANKQAIRVK